MSTPETFPVVMLLHSRAGFWIPSLPMKRVPPRALPILAVFAMFTAVPTLAGAQQRHVLRPIGQDAAAPVATTATPAATAATAAAAADAGVKEKGKEGPDQKKRRTDYIATIKKEIRAIVPVHQLSAADQELIRQHWRQTMRTFRIRVLAEDDNDAAAVARCDALVAKFDQQLLGKLTESHKKGAAAPAKDGGAK